jgi:CMP-N-acetylneuraminic acid synthetase
MKTVGIFAPARLGSERLPRKHLLPIGDTCMFDICCKKLQRLKVEYNIPTYVLICDEELIEIAKKYPEVTILYRDIATSQANGPLQFIYKDILDTDEDYMMFLNPCLIFLSCETIVANVEKFKSSDKEYGTSVKEFKNWLWNKEEKLVNYLDYKRMSTKEIDPWYQCAHGFHVFNKHNFSVDGCMIKEDLCLMPISEEEAIDIDEYHEYEFAKWKWEH